MEKYNKYPKGSEWRKWDLHVHAPTKFTCAKKDEYKGAGLDEKQKNFIEELKEIEDIAVLGITDYFSLDAYKLVLHHKNSIKFDLILPNIEMRISPVTGNNRKINLHLIPNMETLSIDDVERFLYKFEIGNDNLTCKESDLIKWGKNIDPKFSNEQAFKRGLNEFYITYEKFFETLNNQSETFRKNVLVGVSNNSNDGASGIKDIQGIRNIIYQGVDFIFSAQDSDRGYFLGESVDKKEEVIRKYDKLLPCIHGSDYHGSLNGRSLCIPDLNRFCWLKADPTFEGLKQIKYEPAQRISISEDAPDEKLLYYLIDKVKFQDSSFTTEEIQINQNLTTIIGGKSTGKSILLRNIAKSVDIEEYNKRLKSVKLSDPRPIEGMEVSWKDGQVSSLDAGDNPNKRIIYIPQSYLNRVVDNDKEYTDIDEIIKEVLLQDEDFHEWYLRLSVKEKAIDDKIEYGIKSLYENLERYKENINELKKVGDEKGVLEQIKKIESEIESIQKKLDLKESQIKEYNKKIEKIKGDRISISILEEDIANLNRLKEVNVSIYNPHEFSFKSDELTTKIEEVRRSKTELYSKDWKSEITGLIEIEEKQLEERRKSTQNAIEEIKPLQVKIDEQKNLTKKYQELEEEQKKDRIIKNLKIKKEEALKNIKEVIVNLCDDASEYYSIYLEAKDMIKLDNLDEELIFDIKTVFKNEKFYQNYIRGYFDGRKINTTDYDYITTFNFQSKEKYNDFLKKVIWSALRDKLPVRRNGVTNKEVITALLKNWFLHSYRVEYDGDQINDMSPGKKSFVLLRLLVDLDNSKCPILIDQPEDDLDNRSIYYQVVQFLRKKKTERQIIIATHNPNLVLGSDAELIVVANQEGKKAKNKTSPFEYVSGAIEHTFPEDDTIEEVLYKRGTQEHICDVLEGGKEAFNKRKNKYSF